MKPYSALKPLKVVLESLEKTTVSSFLVEVKSPFCVPQSLPSKRSPEAGPSYTLTESNRQSFNQSVSRLTTRGAEERRRLNQSVSRLTTGGSKREGDKAKRCAETKLDIKGGVHSSGEGVLKFKLNSQSRYTITPFCVALSEPLYLFPITEPGMCANIVFSAHTEWTA